MKNYFYLLIGLLSFYSCISIPEEIEPALEKSGNNKRELIKVIRHYNTKADSLKLKAAIFLIKNMDGLQTLDSNSVAQNNPYFTIMENLSKRYNGRYSLDIVYNSLDSFLRLEKTAPRNPQVKYVFDIQTLKSDFLINNIDLAFKSWQSNAWSKKVNFKDFCEYILPYRCNDTYWENSRIYFINKYLWIRDSVKSRNNCFEAESIIRNDVEKWFNEQGTLFLKYPFLRPISFFNVLRGKWGVCEDANSLKGTAMRSMGIPISFNFLPQWGNHPASHSFYSVIDPTNDTIKHLITNDTKHPRNTTYIISGTSFDDFKNIKDLPPEFVILYTKTIPKVFRDCFSWQEESLGALISSKDIVPPLFKNDRMADVTDQYVDCIDVKLKFRMPANDTYAYLCVFNYKGWNPVQWSKIDGGEAIFRNMGKNIVYLPVYYKKEGLIPAGHPFLLTLDGKIEEIIPKNRKQSVKLYRKYPYFIHLAEKASHMIGIRFQAANRSDFSDSVTLYTIKKLPYDMTEVKINNLMKFRYLICQFKGKRETYIAETEFWGANLGKEIKLGGSKMGNKGRYGFSIDKVMDGDKDSYFGSNTSEPNYFGIDLGKGKEKRITKIRFCPVNDTNYILDGNWYELFFWDNEWISLGKRKGVNMKPLIYNNAPIGALFWLRNISQGKEERIFTYDNEKQYFW